MQQAVRSIPHNRFSSSCLATVGAAPIFVLLAVIGCNAPPVSEAPQRPFEGQKLTLSCPEPAMADAITPMARAWEARTGASVAVRREPMTADDATDVGV